MKIILAANRILKIFYKMSLKLLTKWLQWDLECSELVWFLELVLLLLIVFSCCYLKDHQLSWNLFLKHADDRFLWCILIGVTFTVFNSNENSLFCFTNVIIIIPCIRACPKIKNFTNFMFKLSFAFDVEIWTKCITSKRKFQLYFTVIFLQFFWLNNLFFFFFSLEWYYNKTIFVMFFNNCLVIGCCGYIFVWEITTLHWI